MSAQPEPHLTDAEQVDKVNETGRTPVLFIHGLWLLPSSWDRWGPVFTQAGYAPLCPGWPDDPDTVAEAYADPEVFANKTVGQVADHYTDHTVPKAISDAIFSKQKRNAGVTEFVEMPNRGHSLTIDAGWREVAEAALAFVKRFA